MNNIKFYLKIVPDYILWILALLASRFVKKENSNSVLIIPAADLNGGFGEDIMIYSLISNFCQGKGVTIMTANLIRRDDFLDDRMKVNYLSGFKELNYFTILNAIKTHAQIYIIGADIMDGTYGYFPTVARLRALKLAKIVGLECKFTGFSVSNRMLPAIKREMLQVSKLVKVKARDIDSYKRLSEFINPTDLILTNDIAFICPGKESTAESSDYSQYRSWRESIGSRKLIGVCPNSIQANKIGLEKYLSGFKILLENFLSNGEFAFVFLFHDLRPLCGDDNDRTISAKLFNYFQQKTLCYFPESIGNGVVLKGYLELIDFTVTGRMHLGISGVVAQKPMFGVCYANKFEGMLKLFEIEPENNLVDYSELTESQTVVPMFLKDMENSIAKIIKFLPNVKDQTLLNGK